MSGLTPYNRWFPANRRGDWAGFGGLDDFFNRNWSLMSDFAGGGFKLDLREEEDRYIVEADLPGVRKEDISLDLHDGQLTIGVNHEDKTEEQKGTYLHRERRFASTQRSIYLPDIKADEISAKFDSGVLEVTVPKQDPKENKTQITID